MSENEDRIYGVLDKLSDQMTQFLTKDLPELKLKVENAFGRMDRLDDRLNRIEQNLTAHVRHEHLQHLDGRLKALEQEKADYKRNVRDVAIAAIFSSGIIVWSLEHFIFKTK